MQSSKKRISQQFERKNLAQTIFGINVHFTVIGNMSDLHLTFVGNKIVIISKS